MEAAMREQVDITTEPTRVNGPAAFVAMADYFSPPAAWPAPWRHKLTSADDALKAIRSGQRVYIGGGCGEPLVLAQGLVGRAAELSNVEIIHVLTAGHAAYAAPALAAAFRVNALFVGP